MPRMSVDEARAFWALSPEVRDSVAGKWIAEQDCYEETRSLNAHWESDIIGDRDANPYLAL